MQIFSPNAGKYGSEKLQIRTPFTHIRFLESEERNSHTDQGEFRDIFSYFFLQKARGKSVIHFVFFVIEQTSRNDLVQFSQQIPVAVSTNFEK